jgi:hypothetical protein
MECDVLPRLRLSEVGWRRPLPADGNAKETTQSLGFS